LWRRRLIDLFKYIGCGGGGCGGGGCGGGGCGGG